jgi:glycerol-3-phosphate dehydrogenase (NAD(P)+)
MPLTRAAVIGTTSWGTTLSILLARNEAEVTLLARDVDEARRLEAAREHPRLPGIAFPPSLRLDTLESWSGEAGLVVCAVPSRTVQENLERVADRVSTDALVVTATKGLDLETGRRMSEVIADGLDVRGVAALSGPNLSREIAAGLPSTTVLAYGGAAEDLERLRASFHSSRMRVYTSTDVAGAEFGGALKNVIAIAGGMVDALEFGDNAKAAIITRGLAEITRLGVAAGADPLTFQGLAGIGDLVATAYSPLSRNRRLGELLGQGLNLEEALEGVGETAEGVATVPAALRLAERLEVDMPIAFGLQLLFDGQLAVADALDALMSREPTSELR